MKNEPTTLTLAGIYGLLQIELEDLNAIDFTELKETFDQICEIRKEISEDLENIIYSIQEIGIINYKGKNPEDLHKQITDIHRIALDVAGKSVRLAAVARRGIIESEDLRRIDRCEGGLYGSDTD